MTIENSDVSLQILPSLDLWGMNEEHAFQLLSSIQWSCKGILDGIWPQIDALSDNLIDQLYDELVSNGILVLLNHALLDNKNKRLFLRNPTGYIRICTPSSCTLLGGWPPREILQYNREKFYLFILKFLEVEKANVSDSNM